MKLLCIDLQGNGRGEKRLGGRTDLEDGVAADRIALGVLAVELCVVETVAGDDAQGDTGDMVYFLPLLEVLLDVALHSVDAGLDGSLGRRLRPRDAPAAGNGNDDGHGETGPRGDVPAA